MWFFFKVALAVILIVAVFLAIGYVFVQRWMVQRLDKALTGDDRYTPDVQINNHVNKDDGDDDDNEDWDEGYISD